MESGRIDEQSPLAQALAAVGDRWTLQVVEALLADRTVAEPEDEEMHYA
jgi:hypothetical protein